MSNRVLAPQLLATVVVIAALAGYGFASSDDEAVIEAAMGSAVESALAAVTPEPTPEPTPIPTPLIIEVVPSACVDAIDGLIASTIDDLTFLLGVYGAYLDFPDETLAQFGKRVEDLIANAPAPPSDAEQDALFDLVNVCRDAS